MRLRHSLRLQVALAFALLGVLVTLLESAGLFFAARELGQRLIDETLDAEMEDFIARRQRNPHSIPPATLSLRGYTLPPAPDAPPIPAAIENAPPGRHDFILNGNPYRLLASRANAARFFMLYDTTRQVRREQRFLLVLAAAGLVMALFSAVFGLWLAGRVILPVTRLSCRVRQLSLDTPAPLLAPDFPQHEVGQLAHAFDLSLERLRAFIQREQAFTADVSHELRTPLAIVQSTLELLADDPRLFPDHLEKIKRMERASLEMTALVSALLLLAREESDPSHAQKECPVVPVLQAVLENHAHLLGRRDVRVETEWRHHPILPVEPIFLQIVAGNLVRNAFTYTEQGVVRICLEEDRLTITDSGQGIPSDEIHKVFDRFHRGGHSAGSGIGLSLVKRICQHHQWSVSIDSPGDSGTVATLRFTS